MYEVARRRNLSKLQRAFVHEGHMLRDGCHHKVAKHPNTPARWRAKHTARASLLRADRRTHHMDDQQRSPVSLTWVGGASVFKWRVCILDDNPDQDPVPTYTERLATLGVDFRIFGGWKSKPERLGFLRDQDAKSFLRGCHLFLVDMDWTNLWTPAQALCLPDLWVQQDFDRALECFADLFETGASKLEVANRLTACKIPTHLRGFGISAALSHINPAARIVFFSGAPTAIEGAEAGAFMQFKTRPVQISRKEDAQFPNSIDKKLS